MSNVEFNSKDAEQDTSAAQLQQAKYHRIRSYGASFTQLVCDYPVLSCFVGIAISVLIGICCIGRYRNLNVLAMAAGGGGLAQGGGNVNPKIAPDGSDRSHDGLEEPNVELGAEGESAGTDKLGTSENMYQYALRESFRGGHVGVCIPLPLPGTQCVLVCRHDELDLVYTDKTGEQNMVRVVSSERSIISENILSLLERQEGVYTTGVLQMLGDGRGDMDATEAEAEAEAEEHRDEEVYRSDVEGEHERVELTGEGSVEHTE